MIFIHIRPAYILSVPKEYGPDDTTVRCPCTCMQDASVAFINSDCWNCLLPPASSLSNQLLRVHVHLYARCSGLILHVFGSILTGDRRAAVVLTESRSPTFLPNEDHGLSVCVPKQPGKLLVALPAGRSEGLLHVLAGYAQADL